MISICIPVYNFNVVSLVNELSNQAESLSIEYEIIIIDDCSQNFKEINKPTCERYNYIELSENVGRAKIRNLFLNYAKYDYLLFLDCDSLITTDHFILKYIEIIKEKPSVVCGGRVYDITPPERDKLLRWKYGILRESQPCEIREKFPNRSFMTNNFLIQKNLFEKIKFDERIQQYGHEDTLFGFSLKKKNITITHIDNPVTNGDIETNDVYLTKTKEGLINLINILNFVTYDNELISDIAVLRFHKKTRKIEPLIYLSFKLLKPLTVFLLTKGYVSLYLFDFYKIGTFVEHLRSNRNRRNKTQKR